MRRTFFQFNRVQSLIQQGTVSDPRTTTRLSLIVGGLLILTGKPVFGVPNFQDDVYPVFKEHCLSCHNPDKKKADLDLSTVKGVQIGSSGGEVVKAGSPDTSLLYMVANHEEDFEPMPPKKPKIPEAQLKLIHAWIAGGLIESEGGKSQLREMSFDLSEGSALKPENPALPEALPVVPVAETNLAPPVIALAASPWADVVATSGHEQIFVFRKSPAPRTLKDFKPVAEPDILIRKAEQDPLDFDGKSLKLEELPTDILDTLEGFTISMWINPNTEMVSQPIFGRGSFRLFLEKGKQGWKIRGQNRDENNGIVYTGRIGEIQAGEWQLVTATCDGRNWEYYYDGTSMTRQPVPENQPGFLNHRDPFYLGGDGSDGPETSFKGGIKDFRLYRRVLNGKEVASIYQNAQVSMAHIGTLPFPEGNVHDLRFSGNGELLIAAGGVGAYSGKVVVFDVKTGARKAEIGDEQDVILSADISSDHQYVAIGTPLKLVKIYSAKDGKLLHKIEKHTDWVTVVRFSPDGSQLATADRNGGIHVWETASGGIVYTLDEHRVKVTALSWRTDGGILASGAEDGKFVLWDMKDGWATRTATGHAEKSENRYTKKTGILDLDFAKDGRLVSAGRDRSLKLWSPDGSAVSDYTGLESLPTKVAFSPDGSLIYSGDLEGNFWIWSGKTLTPIEMITVGRSSFANLAK